MTLNCQRAHSHKAGLLGVTVLVSFWLFLRVDAFSVIAAGFILSMWMQLFWLKRKLCRLSISRTVKPTKTFIGETVTISHTIQGDLPGISVGFSSSVQSNLLTASSVERVVTLSEKPVNLETRVAFYSRGVKHLSECLVSYEHPLGLFKIWAVYSVAQQVLILPKIMKIERLPVRLRDLLPGKRSDFRLLEDNNEILGIQEYSSQPINKIHWKVSAKLGKLYVKELDYTAKAEILVYLDLNLSRDIFAREVWSHIRKRYEEDAVLIASSIVYWSETYGHRCDLVVIGGEVVERRKENDWVKTVEILSAAQGSEDGPQIDEKLEKDLDLLTPATTVLIISMYLTDRMIPLLMRAKSKCSRVLVLLMPYGFRDPRYKPGKSYDMYPVDMERFLAQSKLLEQEQIIVKLIRPNQSFQEVVDQIDQ